MQNEKKKEQASNANPKSAPGSLFPPNKKPTQPTPRQKATESGPYDYNTAAENFFFTLG